MSKITIEEPFIFGRPLREIRQELQKEHHCKVKLLSRTILGHQQRKFVYEFLLLKPESAGVPQVSTAPQHNPNAEEFDTHLEDEAETEPDETDDQKLLADGILSVPEQPTTPE
jgi:hypothetical protein